MQLTLCFFHSQESQQQQRNDENNAAMDLINSVVGVDEEGRSRQRILTFAARRYRDHFCPQLGSLLLLQSHSLLCNLFQLLGT